MTYTQTPCSQDPAAWDLSASRGDLVDQAREAVRWCEVCPGRQACGLLAMDQPPEHNTVIGALVSYEGRLMGFEEFSELMDTSATKVKCALDGCDKRFVQGNSAHIYCTKNHRERARVWRHRADLLDGKPPATCRLNECDKQFTPVHSRQKYCSEAHREEGRLRRRAIDMANHNRKRVDANAQKRQERDAKAVELVAAGKSYREAAAELNSHYGTVRRACLKANQPSRLTPFSHLEAAQVA